jgi:hypothetical protein
MAYKPRFSAANDNDILNDQRAIDRGIPNHQIEHWRAILQQTGSNGVAPSNKRYHYVLGGAARVG